MNPMGHLSPENSTFRSYSGERSTKSKRAPWISSADGLNMCDSIQTKMYSSVLCCASIIIRALASPTPAELKLFGDWQHDENFGSAKIRSLVECRLPDVYLRHMSAHQLASLRSADVYWIHGLAHRISPMLGEAVKAIYLRRTPPEAFNAPLPEVKIQFFWDDGSVNRTSGKAWLSSSGLACHRFSLDIGKGDTCPYWYSRSTSTHCNWGLPELF